MITEQINRERVEIINQRRKIEQKISNLMVALENLQNECPHIDKLQEYKSNTGNYDPSCDLYWIEYRCPDCGKFWKEYQ
jgi:hypothetical protein